MTSLKIAVPVALLAAAGLAPAAAQTAPPAAAPSIAAYFRGTWSCTSQRGAQVVKAYGLADMGSTLVLVNPFVSAAGNLGMFVEHYTEQNGTLSVAEMAPDYSYAGTSTGWSGNTLQFVGNLTEQSVTTVQRMTYTRVDDDRFTRVFETASTANGPWTQTSNETCTRLVPSTTATPAGM